MMSFDSGQSTEINRCIPEWSRANVLGYLIDKPFSSEGFDDLETRTRAVLAEHEAFRLLVVFRNYQGWMPDAPGRDMAFTAEFGRKQEKTALVSPPEKIVMLVHMRSPSGGNLRVFAENELQDALSWIHQP